MFYITQTVFKIIILIPLVFWNLGTIELWAETEDGEGIYGEMELLREEADRFNQKIKKNEEEVRAFSRQEAETVGQLEGIEISLDQARKHLSQCRLELQTVEEQIKTTQTAIMDLSNQIAEGESRASHRLVGLYKLNRLGTFHVLASTHSISEFLQRKKALERILVFDQEMLSGLESRKTEMQHLAASLEEQKHARAALEKDQEQQFQLLFHQKAQREKLIEEIRGKKSLARASLASLRKASTALDLKIKKLYLSTDSGGGQSGAFASQKGLFDRPVEGKIVSFFGPYMNDDYGVMNFQSGINIQAERGTPVRAVFEGKIIFADWFKGYGNMIIIDHGEHYYTLYAHAEELLKNRDDRVSAGEIVGTVGDSGSMTGPGLHFEVRHHGTPMDPLEWLKKDNKGVDHVSTE
jgi:septal ring factor EnvC (AmiA/AmiB activator)